MSSTIADLKRERREVLDWLRAARHQAIDSYLPNSETVRESCLDDVGTCDLYVLILGHRYGFVPIDGNPGGLSITHLEFRRAGEFGIPRVALLRTSIPDVSVSDIADPKRVLAFRDEVARAVRAAEFSDLKGLILGLSTGIQAELDKLDKLAKRSAGQAVAGQALQLAPRSAFLAGRVKLLAELDDRLSAHDGAGPRVVALCGLGGAGKTSVALEYAHRHLGEVGVAWQFPAEDPAVLTANFGELAFQLGGRELPDSRDPVAWVHGALATYPGEWLLVFDNAPDRASVAPFVPSAGRGRVLITSRAQMWPPGQALDVPMLDPEVAAQFLGSRTGDPDRQAAMELADELGGLPLALEQAAVYIQAHGDSLASYLAWFRRRRAELLARGEPTGYSQTVATTWRLAFEQLQQAAPGAVGLLRLLAACAPEAVPLHLLLRLRPGLDDQLSPEVAPVLVPLLEDEMAGADAIAALRRYSLITPVGEGSVSVHRLVQALTADQMPAELAAVWRDATAAVIEAALPDDPAAPETWPVFAALLPHAQAALTDDSGGIQRTADYLGQSGSYPAARDLYQRVFNARMRVLGLAHPDTLTARANLARWTGLAGDAAAARDLYAELLPIRERVSGPEHPDTLTARADLALWTGQAGDPAAARDQYAALLPVDERVLGPEHPATLDARADLAHWTGRAGDAAAARDQYAALLPVDERVLGPEHPGTLAARVSLARWTGEAGDAAAARDLLAALLPLRERVLGPEHPSTLNARDSLARWTGEAGDAAAARDLYAELLPIRERVSGPEHPTTLDARAHLAHWTGEAGNPAAARDQYAALLPVDERVLGPEHPDTLSDRDELARWTGRADGAPSTA